MKKYIIILIFLLIPLISWAEFDFLSTNTTNTKINSIELIWSADTYTPHEYEGRKLASSGSKIIIDALLNISNGTKNDLKFSWFYENIFQKTKSGYGKDSFYFYANQLPGGIHTIKVQIFNDDRSIFEEKEIIIPIVDTELFISSSIISPGREFSFIAKPYFFSINKLTDLEFEWNVLGQDPIVSSGYNASVLNLSISDKENNNVLESNLSLKISNKNGSNQEEFKTINFLIY
ncbi:MAG: hypothetical protein ABIJ17_00110 [Patescibacteria group bacterium]